VPQDVAANIHRPSRTASQESQDCYRTVSATEQPPCWCSANERVSHSDRKL